MSAELEAKIDGDQHVPFCSFQLQSRLQQEGLSRFSKQS